MTLCNRLTVIILFFALPFVSTAQESSPDSKAQVISEIIHETSIKGEMKQSVEELQNQFAQNPFGLPSDKNAKMMDIFAQSFSPDSMIHSIRETFRNQYKPASADSTIEWLNTPNTQKALNFEKEFYTLQGIRKRVVNRYELQKNPPSQRRTELIKSLKKDMSASQSEIESQAIIFRALVSAFSTLSDQRSFSEQQIDTFVNNYRGQVQSQIDQQIVDQLLIKYHGLDNETLQKYASFFATEHGQWLSETTSESIHNALQKASDRFLKSINNIQ